MELQGNMEYGAPDTWRIWSSKGIWGWMNDRKKERRETFLGKPKAGNILADSKTN